MSERESLCDHGYPMGECPDEGCLHRKEVRNALLGLAGAMTAAGDQAGAMTDAELGALLTSGRWSTIEVHEAGRRLMRRAAELETLADTFARVLGWLRDPTPMETESEMAEVADAALFRAEMVLHRDE